MELAVAGTLARDTAPGVHARLMRAPILRADSPSLFSALGIGANIALFTVVNAVLLKTAARRSSRSPGSCL